MAAAPEPDSQDRDSLDREILRRVTASCRELIHKTGTSLALPTPCTDWSVGDLLDHLTGGNRFTIAILGGTSADVAVRSAHASFGADHEAVPAILTSLDDQQAVFSEPGALDRRCSHVLDEITGAQVLRLRIHDMGVHTWDLSQALGINDDLLPDYAQWAIDELAHPDSLTAKHTATSLRNPSTSNEVLQAFDRIPCGAST